MANGPRIALTLTLQNGEFVIGLQAVKKAIADVGTEVGAQKTKLDAFSNALDSKLNTSLKTAATNMKAMAAAAETGGNALSASSAKMKGAEQNTVNLASGIDKLAKKWKEAESAANNSTGWTRFMKTMEGVAAGAQKVEAALGRVQTIVRFLDTAAAGGLAGLVGGVALLAKQGIGVAAQFERMQVSFETMLKSRGEARGLIADLIKFAAKTPFQVPEVEEAAKLLLGFRTARKEIISDLTIMGQQAAVMKLPLDQVIREMMELRQGRFVIQQLAPLGLGDRKAFEALGIKFGRQGQLESTGEAAFQAALKLMQGTSGGLFEVINRTIEGMFSNLKDAITLRLKALGEGIAPGLKSVLGPLLEQLQNFGQNDALDKGLRALGQQIGQFIAGAGGQLLQWLTKVLDYLDSHPDALADAFGLITQAAQTLLVVVVTLTGLQGLLGLAEGITTILGLFAGPEGWIVVVAALIAVLVGGGSLNAALNTIQSGLNTTGETMTGLAATTQRAMERMRSEFGKTYDSGQSLISKLLELQDLQNANSRTGRQRDQLNKIGYDLVQAGQDYLTVNVGGPQGPEKTIRASQLGLDFGAASADKLKAMKLYYQGMPLTAVYDNPASGYALYEALGLQKGRPSYNTAGDEAAMDAEMKRRARQPQDPGDSVYPPTGAGAGDGTEDKRSPEQRYWDAQIAAANAADKNLINSQPGGSGLICVVKTGKTIMAFGGPDAQAFHDKFFGTQSSSSLLTNLQQGGEKRLGAKDLQIGDIVVLDRVNGPNGGKDGHTGLFMGYGPNGELLISGNHKGGVTNSGKLPFIDPSIAYSGQAGVYAFANPFSQTRQLLGGFGAAPASSWESISATAGAKPGSPALAAAVAASMHVMDSFFDATGLSSKIDLLTKLRDGIRDFIAGLEEQVNRLRGLSDSLRNSGRSLNLAFLRATGQDRQADWQTAVYARDDVMRAHKEQLRAEAGGDVEKIAVARIHTAEELTKALELVTQFKGNDNTKGLAQQLFSDVKDLVPGLQEELQQSQMSVQGRLALATGNLSDATSRLGGILSQLAQAVNALARSKGVFAAAGLGGMTGAGAQLPGINFAPAFGTSGNVGTAPVGFGGQSWSVEQAVANGYTDPSQYEVYQDCSAGDGT